MRKNFLKMHGLGNDFVVFDARPAFFALKPAAIRRIAHRRTGVGFDQMVVLAAPVSAGTDVYMHIFNADGSDVQACGNVTRCVALYLSENMKKQDVTIETRVARIKCRVEGGTVAVDMNEPKSNYQNIPLSHELDTLSVDVLPDILPPAVAVSIGNPHAVFFVDDVEAFPVETYGPQVENHPLFPERVNVEFATVLDRRTIRMRVWERGAGVTMACGTGACATVVAAVRRGLTDRRVTVMLDGGTLDIEWREGDNHILMTGDATLAFEGTIALTLDDLL